MHRRFLAVLAILAAPALHAAPALAAQPEMVGAGVVSTALHDFAPAATPDGRTLLFTVTDAGFSRMTLMQSRFADGRWQAPTVLPFSGVWNDGDGALSPDGRRFVFISNRPAQGAAAKADLDLWLVERGADGSWGEPRRLPDSINSNVNETYPSLAADGTLYFGRAGGEGALFRARYADGVWQAPERLPFNGFSFAIAPDQRYAIVGIADASRNSDLHLVTQRDGKWGTPARIEGSVNTPQAELAGSMSGDGRTLYFVSARRGAAETWPRVRRVQSAADVAAELGAIPYNGLRNIYKVDLTGLVEGLAP